MSYIDKVTVSGSTYDIQDARGDSLALIDGYYESMTVGNAEQLIATVGVEDKVPYNFRTSGGSADIGDREVDKLVGGTVAWNQQLKNADFSNSTANWTVGSNATASVSNGILTAVKKNETASGNQSIYQSGISIPAGHKALWSAYIASDSSQIIIQFVCSNPWTVTKQTFVDVTSTLTQYGGVMANTTDYKSDMFIVNFDNKENVILKSPQVIDLTQMFGSTIADYIYSLETSTPGAGVAWFRSLFPKPFYSYNSGELMSVQTNAHNMVGFNAWDEVTENGILNISTGANNPSPTNNQLRSKNYVPIVPGASYAFTANPNVWVMFYDSNKNVVSPNASSSYYTATNAIQLGSVDVSAKPAGAQKYFTVPSNACYLRFYTQVTYGTSYKNDICIHLHWDGERDGEYEPYSLHSYPLDDVELRGIPKLDSNNKLYYDGDVYESNGTVTRKYRLVTSGFSRGDIDSTGKLYAVKALSSGTITNSNAVSCFSNLLESSSLEGSRAKATNGEKSICAYSGSIYVGGYVGDENALDTLLQSLQVIYVLVTPTTEEADPYQNPQAVSDWGTEEYVDAAATAQTSPRDVAIPVGHETMYQNNLRAKLEMSPESPSGDGDYIVRQANGQNTYVQLTFPADELPAPPTTDGNYQLKCTVSSGTATYTWAAIT